METSTDYTALSTAELVDMMVAAGEWPAPDLMDAIAARGDEAVAPLARVLELEIDPEDWPAFAPISHALLLLSSLDSTPALPELIKLFKNTGEFEDMDLISDAISAAGEAGAMALLDLARDPTATPSQQIAAAGDATDLVAQYPALRDPLAAGMREVLAGYVQRGDDSELTDEDFEQIGFTISNLAQLRDPQARELIDAAFDAEIVEEFIINRQQVAEMYEGKYPAYPHEPFNWLARYHEMYADKDKEDTAFGGALLDRDLDAPDFPPFNPAALPSFQTPPPFMPLPTARLGRNDPCWCGSGKKYKKCHLDADLGRK